jgi:RNA ligase (TIGR02306 family)
MERKLASIQKIVDIQPIEGADMIEVATVLGWHCVVKKGEFQPDDLCVYFEVDSLLPVKEQYEFLRKSCFNSRLNGFRIKTIKLRGQVSQGLAIPVEDVFGKIDMLDLKEGLDVTEILGVRKYEVEIPVSLSGAAKGNFPSFVPKTDEIRIQSVPAVLTRYNGVPFVVTEKLDGTSSTYYVKDGEFGFCSRNWDFKEDTENTYAKIAKKYDIKEKLSKFGKNIAIQGEIVGPAIQKNRYKLADHMLFVYHVFDIDNYRYFSHNDLEDFSTEFGFNIVPTVARGIFLEECMRSVDEAVEFSVGQSLIYKDMQREGIVVKSALEKRDPDIGRLSFKVINPKYLLKYED